MCYECAVRMFIFVWLSFIHPEPHWILTSWNRVYKSLVFFISFPWPSHDEGSYFFDFLGMLCDPLNVGQFPLENKEIDEKDF